MKTILSKLILITLFLIPLLMMCNKTCIAAWAPMTSGTSEALTAIWGSSGSDVFAVGYNGTILHYDGTSWSPMNSGTSQSLMNVWGSSGSDVFAVGFNGTILHYDGTSWSPMVNPATAMLTGVWGASGSNVFAVGIYGTILHYNGTTWSSMDSGTSRWFVDVWGSSGSDVFAVGDHGYIYHYDGFEWSYMIDITSVYSLAGVWGSSGSNVFVGGTDGVILNYDGSNWTLMMSGSSATFPGVWGSSGTNVFVVGSNGIILNYDGFNWDPMVSGLSESLNRIWGSSGSDVFAVGNNGAILHYDGIECQSNGDCDDGLYCNGIETCDIGNETCLPGMPVSCPDGQICDEDSNQCVIPPPCSVTIIPSSVTLYTWESFLFGTTLEGTCNEPCFSWEISLQESTGSTIYHNGVYTAGGNAGTDIIQVTDPCNGNMSAYATVNVVATTTTTTVPCIPDGFEPDDIPPAANPIAANSCQSHSICPTGDHDYLQFELTSESGVVLETFGPSGDTVICLYNSSGAVIECDDDGGSDYFSYIQQPCLPADTYFLEIYGYADYQAIPQYNICLTLNPCPLPVPLDCTKLLASSQFGELFRIDVTTGISELIGYMPYTLATEIEYDTLTQTLYAEEVDGYPNLHIIDPERGNSLGYVTHEYGSLQGLEFVGATLYGTFIYGYPPESILVTVDTSTGVLTPIGFTGLNQISGLAYDTRTGVMYGITAGGAPANLVRINLTTGTATVVGYTGLDRVGSIEFGPDGNLYGGVTANGSSLPTYLIRINTATGAATPIGETGFSITGLTACQAGEEIVFDIKPNPLNLKCQGVLPAAVLGTVEFDPRSIDPDSLRLTREGVDAGVAPINYTFTDGVQPTHGDMLLKFKVPVVVDTLMLNELAGQTVPLLLTGETVDGIPISGQDFVLLLGNIVRECHSDLDCDTDVDGTDASTFKRNYGRSGIHNPCSDEYPCEGDLDNDSDVDGRDASTFKSSYGTMLYWPR